VSRKLRVPESNFTAASEESPHRQIVDENGQDTLSVAKGYVRTYERVTPSGKNCCVLITLIGIRNCRFLQSSKILSFWYTTIYCSSKDGPAERAFR
jgi:hypothetical protein